MRCVYSRCYWTIEAQNSHENAGVILLFSCTQQCVMGQGTMGPMLPVYFQSERFANNEMLLKHEENWQLIITYIESVIVPDGLFRRSWSLYWLRWLGCGCRLAGEGCRGRRGSRCRCSGVPNSFSSIDISEIGANGHDGL